MLMFRELIMASTVNTPRGYEPQGESLGDTCVLEPEKVLEEAIGNEPQSALQETIGYEPQSALEVQLLVSHAVVRAVSVE